MKKLLSVLLSLTLLMSMSAAALAGDELPDETPAAELSYDIVIPNAILMTEPGLVEIGTPTVANVENATENTVISYTATGTPFTNTEYNSLTMPATYFTDAGETELTDASIKVYSDGAEVDPLTTLYVYVDESDWKGAEPGRYVAYVSFAFDDEELTPTLPDTMTVADLLGASTCFPIYESRQGEKPLDAWVDEGGAWCYAFGSNLCIHYYEDDWNDMDFSLATVCTRDGIDYIGKPFETVTFTFHCDEAGVMNSMDFANTNHSFRFVPPPPF